MMLRKFGFKKSEPRESEARLKLQKELFAYTKCVDHGFPHKPTAMAYDAKLKLLAIGTKNGELRIVGQPGVEFSACHKTDISVTHLTFLPEQGRLISHCSDNSLHLWELNVHDNVTVLEEVKEYAMEASKLKNISAVCLTANGEQLLLGTEGGNIHLLDVASFTLSENIIYQDVVMQNVPDDFKVTPGAVEAIAQSPADPNKFLIGYNRGLIVLWDIKESNADQTYNATQQLESLAWQRGGTEFMTAHADGSYIIWSSTDSTKPKEQANTPYGPFPCKAINKVQWKTAKADNYIVFSGGMPRPSYADRHTVSVMHGAKQVVFDFTSRVVDFLTLSYADETDDLQVGEWDDPHVVLVLAEEELVAIDLQSENWPTFRQPYLASPHSSAITTAHHVCNVPEQFWTKIIDAGDVQMANYSTRDWPIEGGKSNVEPSTAKDLLLTGHEDGTVRFWDASTTSMRMVYKLGTAGIFGLDFGGSDANADSDEEWPPFRKVGTFDPYSDDPRLGIQKVALCPISETLVIGGTAGQVCVFSFEREERQTEVKATTVNIVSDRDNFIWKGHEALKVSEGDVKFAAGFQPTSVMQMYPPAACTALGIHSEWQLVAAGTAHGLGLFDYHQKKEVTTKCTLNPNDLTGTGDSAMSRRKSFKKSLRESFRRLRKRRSERRKKGEEKPAAEEKKEEAKSTEGEAKAEGGEQAAAAEGGSPAKEAAPKESPSGSPAKAGTPAGSPTTPEGNRTIERAIEFRSTDDSMASMVRFLYFADTFLINGQNHTPTLWAGTNAGTIYVFQITIPANDKRDSDGVVCQLGKEIHLKHHAPVVAIGVLDRTATPLPQAFEVQHQRAKAPDMSGQHQVVICSEEQFKIFSLPSLKPQNKYKLTAHEGSKVRKIGFVNYRSRSDENYIENNLTVVTNQGDVQVFSIPHLRRQLKAQAIRRDNVHGIVSSFLTSNGEGFYPSYPSEFVRFSVSASVRHSPQCEVELKEGMRPPPPEPEPEAEAEVEAPAETETTEAVAVETPAAEQQEQQEGAPADTSAAEGAAEGDKADEQAPADGANDSVATGDLTIDSVKVHLSEDNSSVSRTVLSSSSSTRTTVTRTVISESTDGERHVISSETHTMTSASGDGGDGGAATEAVTVPFGSQGDDIQFSQQVNDEEAEKSEMITSPLPTLKITEDGDDDQQQTQEAVAKDADQSTAEQLGHSEMAPEVNGEVIESDATPVKDIASEKLVDNDTSVPAAAATEA